MNQIWVSQAHCEGCDWSVAPSPALDVVADAAKAHRSEGHHVVVEDEKTLRG